MIVEEHGEKRLLEAKPLKRYDRLWGSIMRRSWKNCHHFAAGWWVTLLYHSIGLAEPVLKLQQDEFPDYDLMLFEK